MQPSQVVPLAQTGIASKNSCLTDHQGNLEFFHVKLFVW
jgi:hypothetical protein